MKEKRSLMNILSSMISQFMTIALGIIIPRMILVNLGSESNGLITSISNILTYVALLEAGVGAASIQALHKPLSEDNKDDINGILSATAHYYKRTGAMYFVIVILLAFVLPFTIKTEIPVEQVILVVLFSGLPGAINYFFQGKYRILLSAEGKSFLLTNLGTFAYVITSVAKIVLLNAGYGVVSIQILGFATNFMQVIYIEIYIRRRYKWLNLNATPAYLKIKQSKNALIHQIAWLITSNTDTIVLTYFCGLKVVSIYSIYTFLYNSIGGIIRSFTEGVHFALGQIYHDDIDKYKRIHSLYEIFIIGICFSLFCICAIYTNPFLKLYTANVSDIKYCDSVLPWLFAVVHILVQARATSWETISVAGHFRETQHQPIIEAVINLSVSLILVCRLGIYGVLLGTVVASTYRLLSMIIYSRRAIMADSPWITCKRYFINIILSLLTCCILQKISVVISVETYFTLLISAAFTSIIVIPFFLIVNLMFEKDSLHLLIRIIKDKINLQHFLKIK